MEFGFCYIPDYHPERHGDWTAWYRRLLDEWTLADRLGFDAIWIAEHRYAGYGFSSPPVVAQAIASCTTNIRVGTAVALLSQRHPLLTAEDWAAVDLLSGGRLNFGIGRGIFAYDFEAVGVPSSESRARFEEAWQVIRRLWTEDDVEHRGEFWSFPAHTLGPKPLQQPTPPAYAGCVASPESYEWAGREGCNIVVSPFLLDSAERQREYIERYREALAAAGHDPAAFRVLANYHLAIANTPGELAQADDAFHAYFRFLHAATNPRNLDHADYAAYQKGGGLYRDVDEMRRSRAVMGTTPECIDRIGELARTCGLDGWMFHLNYGGIAPERVTEQLHALREDVVPAFRSP